MITAPALGATSGANGTHDPSRIIESDGKFYFCSTGGGCASSTDGLAWANAGALRIAVPSWSTTYMSGGNQGVWAPDLIFFNNQYFIYYSFCGVPAANAPCVIGLLTTPTLNAGSSSFKLTDVGMVVNNPTNDTTYQFSTIDPAPIVDSGGNLWLVWGSGYGKDQTKTQIWITRLDNTTGLPLTSDGAYQPPTVLGYPLKTGTKEGSYMHYHGGYYYLFWNEGSCCNGTSSTYTIWVSRSTSITGPFTGDKTFYASTGNIHGPGHMGIYSACGVERFTYHYYPTSASILGENELTWGSDGWPVVGAESTTPLIPCGQTGGGGATGTGGATSGRDAGATGGVRDGLDAAATGGAVGSGGSSGSSGGPGIGGGFGGGGSGAGTGGTIVARDAGAMGGTVGGGGGPGGAGSSGVGTGGSAVAGSGGSGGGSGGAGAGGSSEHVSADAGTIGASRAGCSCVMGGKGGQGFSVGPLLFLAVVVVAARRRRQRG